MLVDAPTCRAYLQALQHSVFCPLQLDSMWLRAVREECVHARFLVLPGIGAERIAPGAPLAKTRTRRRLQREPD